MSWWLLFVGCSTAPLCAAEGDELAVVDGDHLTCAEADLLPRYVVRLAGRELITSDRQIAFTGVKAKFEADPAATHAWLAQAKAEGARLEGTHDRAAIADRAAAVWAAEKGEGLIHADDGDLWNLQSRALSVWARDDEERLALTETDIEGWIRYISLCREAQGAEPLRLSVADRVTVYNMVVQTFEAGSRDQQLALAGLGVFWPEVKERWQAATYEQQQAWIANAPMPPPMTATSLGYAEAVLQSDVVRHTAAFYANIGPFTLGYGERAFGGAP